MQHTNLINNETSETLQNLHKQIRSCRHCQQDFGFEPHPIVFGNSQAKIMQISQAPSRTVHETGKPFNDASGRRLRREWYRITDEAFYNPDNFYIVSIAHCYPGKLPKGGDRHPPVCCADQWLTQELKLVKNDIYILIGSAAASYFFPDAKMTDLVFQNLEMNGKPAFVLSHPSPLNVKWFQDNPTFLEKRIFEVSKAVRDALGIDLNSNS